MYKAVRLFNYKDGIGLEQDALRGVCEVEGGKLVGMLSLADMARRCDMEAAAALADISSNLRRAAPPKKSEEN